MVQSEPRTLFVFGDNMVGMGYGGQAREMRDEPNAVGIPTKNYPGVKPADYFCDDDFAIATAKISAAFMQLIAHAQGGGSIVWPLDDIGTGMSDLPNKSPKIWAFVQDQKSHLEKISRRK